MNVHSLVPFVALSCLFVARSHSRFCVPSQIPVRPNLDWSAGGFLSWQGKFMQAAQTANITSVLKEARVFKPSKEFAKQAHIKSLAEYRKLYRESIRSPEKFWAKQAKNELVWFKPWKTVLQWKEPFAKWFVGGQLNVSYNCLDRHLNTPRANKAALVWEGEPAAAGKA